MSDMEKMPSNNLSAKDSNQQATVIAVSEYDEYLGLCEVMTDEKLKKLVRKIE